MKTEAGATKGSSDPESVFGGAGTPFYLSSGRDCGNQEVESPGRKRVVYISRDEGAESERAIRCLARRHKDESDQRLLVAVSATAMTIVEVRLWCVTAHAAD